MAACAMGEDPLEGEEPTEIELAPDYSIDTGSGTTQSGISTCPTTPPSGGSDPVLIAYSAEQNGACCWKNYLEKTYKPFMGMLMCM
jgi:hypothetical protein